MSRFSKTILILSTLLLIAQIVSIIFIDSNIAVVHIAFQLFENLLMIIVSLIPLILGRTTKVRIPKAMEIAFVGFCFASLVMGDLLDFYGRFSWWDMLLHAISGIMLGILGYAILNTIFDNEIKSPHISPLFVSIWVICFALAAGAIWEIWEYITDGIFGLNSQQFLVTSGTFDTTSPLQGRDALKDTMEDLILDLAGACIIAIGAYIDTINHRKSISNSGKVVDSATNKHQNPVKQSKLLINRV